MYHIQSFVKKNVSFHSFLYLLVFKLITVLLKKNQWWQSQLEVEFLLHQPKDYFQCSLHSDTNCVYYKQLLVFKHCYWIHSLDYVIFRRERKRTEEHRVKLLSPIQAHGDILTGGACCPLSSFSVDIRSISNSFIRFSFSGSSPL